MTGAPLSAVPALAPGAVHPVSYTTASVRPEERLAYWREAVHETVSALDIAPRRVEPFSGTLTLHPFDAIRVAHGVSDAHVVRRTHAHIARSGGRHLFLLCPTRGALGVQQLGRSAQLSERECALVTDDEPFVMDFPTHHELISIRLDRDALASRLPSIHDAVSINLARETRTGKALAEYVQALPLGDRRGDFARRATQARVLFDLTALTAAEAARPVPALACGPLTARRVVAFIEAHLSAPDLSPSSAARAFGVSERAVHAAMKPAGDSFMEVVRARRLDRIALTLARCGHDKGRVTDLAFDWGFGSLSTFNRAFQARFGMSPTEFARANGAAVTPSAR